MADMQYIIDQLHEAREEISARIAALIEERKPIEAALAALGVDNGWKLVPARPTTSSSAANAQFAVVDAAPAVKLKPTPTTRSEKMKAAAAEMVPCPECDVSMSKFGIATHRRVKHGVDVPRTSEADRKQQERARKATPATPTPQATGRTVLACSECDATFAIDKASELSRHTITAHRRGPLTAERQPVAA